MGQERKDVIHFVTAHKNSALSSQHIAFPLDGSVIIVNLEDDFYAWRLRTPEEVEAFITEIRTAATEAFQKKG
jgi:hypothetical protein